MNDIQRNNAIDAVITIPGLNIANRSIAEQIVDRVLDATRIQPVASIAELRIRAFNARVDQAAKAIYVKAVDESGIHSNRSPSWEELSEESKHPYRKRVDTAPILREFS